MIGAITTPSFGAIVSSSCDNVSSITSGLEPGVGGAASIGVAPCPEAVGAYMEQTFLAAAQGVAGRRRARKRADRGPFVVSTDKEAE